MNPATADQPKDQSASDLELYGRLRLGALVLILLALGVFIRCNSAHNDNPTKETKISGDTKVIENSPSKALKAKEKYVPPEGSVTITPKDPSKTLDEVVKIHYKEMGFTFEPGIECSVNLYFSCGVDAKMAYAYRFGVGAGVVTGNNVVMVLSPSVFISYRLDQIHLPNTEAALTYVPLGKIPFGVGLRLNF